MNQRGAVARGCVLTKLSNILADDESCAALITGHSGIGKSWILEQLGALARERGWNVQPVIASPSTKGLALAPFAHLEHLAAPPALDPGERLARLVSTLRTLPGAGVGRLLLIVDDVEHLDSASAVLLHQLVGARPGAGRDDGTRRARTSRGDRSARPSRQVDHVPPLNLSTGRTPMP